jgi:hypothetical protein
MEVSQLVIASFVMIFFIMISLGTVTNMVQETNQSISSPVFQSVQSKYNTTQQSMSNLTATMKDRITNDTNSNPVSSFIMGFSALWEAGIHIFDFTTYIPDLISATFEFVGIPFTNTPIIGVLDTIVKAIIMVVILFGVINFFRGLNRL